MKRHILFITSLLVSCLLFAQGPSNRTAKTVAADVLAQMPAQNQETFNSLMNDLAESGEEGILTLTQMLKAPGEGSNAQVEYALSGLTAFVSTPGHETQQAVVLAALNKAAAQASNATVKAFLESQSSLLSRSFSMAEVQIPAIAVAQRNAKTALKSGKKQDRIMAMKQVMSLLPAKDAQKTALAALKDGNKDYRDALLYAASSVADNGFYNDLVKTMLKAKPAVQADILNFLASEAAQSADKRQAIKSSEARWDNPTLNILNNFIKNSNDFDIVEAAVDVLRNIGDASSVPVIASLLSKTDSKYVNLAQSALASFNGKINSDVAKAMSDASPIGQIAGIELLAGRKATVNLGTVLALVDSKDANVKAAAYKALKDLVSPQDLTKMCGLLEEADADAYSPLQQAITATLAGQTPEQQVQTISQRMIQAGAGKSFLYFPVLAATGDATALQTIVNALNTGSQASRDAAFQALLTWPGLDAAPHLYNIARQASGEQFEKALGRYIELGSSETLTGENQLQLLRQAMEIAKTDKQRNTILEKIDKTGTFLGMMFASEFINTPALQQTAATAVMDIAVAHPEFNGTNTRALLEKVVEVLSGGDADYFKQNIKKYLEENPADEAGFVSIFNGKDLTGWKGLVEDPIKRSKMKPAQLAKEQIKADEQMRKDWIVEGGSLAYVGTGYDNLCTEKQYGDFEMLVDWKLDPNGAEPDAGIYLRGSPQVQIWDTARVDVGAQVGSGGLYNNKINKDIPLVVADNKLGEWNSFYIKMVGDRVTVKLNGILVVDDVILENYWDRSQPIFPIEQLELQAHGSKVWFRNIYVKELKRSEPFQLSEQEKKEGFKVLFDGTNMYQWTGNTVDYTIEDGCISMNPSKAFGGNLYTVDEYADFIYRFEFQLTPGANNGVGIRTPMEGDAAYVGMEIQILDCEHPTYSYITPLQHHGSVYGIIPAKADHPSAFKPAGEWNEEEIYAKGDYIRVTVNGQIITEGDIREATKNGTADKKEHPGLFNKQGHIGFLGHGSPVKFRNIRIKELK